MSKVFRKTFNISEGGRLIDSLIIVGREPLTFIGSNWMCTWPWLALIKCFNIIFGHLSKLIRKTCNISECGRLIDSSRRFVIYLWQQEDGWIDWFYGTVTGFCGQQRLFEGARVKPKQTWKRTWLETFMKSAGVDRLPKWTWCKEAIWKVELFSIFGRLIFRFKKRALFRMWKINWWFRG